jgi:hypothetical protein
MGKFKIQFKNQQFDYEMSEPNDQFCHSKSILVIIVTRADIEGYLNRRAIRKSWLKKDVSLFIYGDSKKFEKTISETKEK